MNGSAPQRKMLAAFPRWLTFARVTPTRVDVDAPDTMIVIFALPLSILLVLGTLYAEGFEGLWPWLVPIVPLAWIGPRTHLRVSTGRVTLVRTICLVPWFFSRCRPQHESFDRWDFDDAYLVAPTHSGTVNVEDKAIVLSAANHGLDERVISELAQAARTALASEG